MPAQPLARNRLKWPLSSAYRVGQIVRVACSYCRSKRYYDPESVARLVGDIDVNSLRRRMSCEGCGRRDYIDVDVFIPMAAERQELRVRRLKEIRIKKIPVWEET